MKGASMEQDNQDKKKLYECNPSKNKECSKTSCYIIGGPCHSTTNEQYKVDDRKGPL